jgi:hypothetical protein
MKMSPWIFPFLYSAKYVKILFFAPLLLLFCDAPFIDPTQPYVISRSGRIAWSLGQLLYVIVLSGLYCVFLLLISNLFIITHVEPSWEWGPVLGTLGNTGAAQSMGLLSTVSPRTLFYFSPVQATCFTLLLSWFSCVFLGLVIYALNSLTNTRSLGILFAASFLVLDSAAGAYHLVAHFSPVSWSNLDYIDIGGLSAYPSITYVYCAFAIVSGVLIVLSIVANKRQEINVVQPV